MTGWKLSRCNGLCVKGGVRVTHLDDRVESESLLWVKA